MINYSEKGAGLHQAITDAGHKMTNRNGIWVSKNEAAVQAIIDAYDPLPEAKARARKLVLKEASKRVAAIYPFINPEKDEAIGLYNFTLDMYKLIKPASRNALTGNLLAFKGIYDTAKQKNAGINAMTDWKLIDALDVTQGW